jgi:ABC-type branched-subunit amino acid transport system substrate-binding protein
MVAPSQLGVLIDMELGALGAPLLEGFRAGLRRAPLDRAVEVVPVQVDGLPVGTEHDVRRGFLELVDAGALAIVGPGITDNALVARDLADAQEVACVNWSGDEETRSRWCFQFQVGSLEEEPALLVDHLVEHGRGRVALVHDQSSIGQRYAEWFEKRRTRSRIDVVARAAISPVAEDATRVIDVVRNSGAEGLVYLGLGRAAHPLAIAKRAAGWEVPAVANTALMQGHSNPGWTEAWEGWVYVDMTSDSNPALQELGRVASEEVMATPVGVCWFDMGHLVGEALSQASHLTRTGVLEGFERVKQLPAACGQAGTTMTLGNWDRGVLKGPYLAMREWRSGRSVEHVTSEYPRHEQDDR